MIVIRPLSRDLGSPNRVSYVYLGSVISVSDLESQYESLTDSVVRGLSGMVLEIVAWLNNEG